MKNFVEQLKEYFDNTPKDVLDKEFEEINSKCGNIGPDVDEYVKFVESIKKKKRK